VYQIKVESSINVLHIKSPFWCTFTNNSIDTVVLMFFFCAVVVNHAAYGDWSNLDKS
jgi:hypothetical protein